MGTIATLAVDFVGSVAGLKESISSAESAIQGAAKKMQTAGATISATITAPLAGLGFVAIKTAADQEQLQVAFETMLGSADKAQTLIQQLTDFSASTPFELPTVVGAGKKLLAFGVEAEAVQDTLRRLGDVSAGVGAPLDEIAEIYGKAKVSGRLFAEDINQLTGRGIPIIQALAGSLGVADSEIKKMVEDGQIGFPELQSAFELMTDEGGQFTGMMEAQSQTLGGLYSTLKDNINIALGGIATELIKTFDIKSIMSSTVEVIGQLKDSILDFVRTNPELTKIIALLVGGLAAAGPVLLGVGTAMSLLAPVVGGLATALGILTGPIGLIIAGVAALGWAWSTNFLSIRDATEPIIQGVTAALQGLWDMISGDLWAEPMGDWSGWWETLSETLGTGAADAIVGFGETLQGLRGYFLAVVEDGDYLNDWLTHLPEWMQLPTKAIGEFVAMAGERWAALADAFATGQTSIDGVIGELVSHFTGLQENFYDTTDSIWEFIAALTGSNEIASTVTDWIWAFAIFRASVQDSIGGVIDQIVAFATGDLWTAVQEPLAGLGESFGGLVETISGLGDKFGEIGQSFGGLGESFQSLLSVFSGGEGGGGLDWGAILGTATIGAVTGAINSMGAIFAIVGVAITVAVNQIKTVIETATGVINGMVTVIQGIQEGDWSTVFQGLTEIFSSFSSFVSETVGNISGGMAEITGAIGGALTQTLTDMGFDAMAAQVQEWVDGIKGFFEYISGLATGSITVDLKVPSWLGQMESWTWPTLPRWTWPTLPTFYWPQLPAFTWPELPTFEWPSIPMPDWVEGLVNWRPFGLGGNQLGTNYFHGGATLVGEGGPELLIPPRGSQIIPNRQLGGLMGGVSITVQKMEVRDDQDIHLLAYQIADILQRS